MPPPTQPQTADIRRREVMVVEDDTDVRSALMECLRHEGISSLGAFDGLDALEQVRWGLTPCAILADVDMPRLSGPGLVAALRADPALPRIPVITMTAGSAPPGVDAEGHLAKPFELHSMLAALFGICRSCGICDGPGPVIGSLYAARRRADLAGAPPRR